MKSSGLRKVDELGRITLPIEIRNKLGIKEKDPLEIFVNGDDIILRKETTSCIICSSHENILSIEYKSICQNCVTKIKKMK